jgi:alpha-beta hydrolase superfamily lysophospholipase
VSITQYKANGCIVSVFAYKTKPSKRSSKSKGPKGVIYYFCGYNDYFYHYHMLNEQFDIVAIDIPGFGFNKQYDPNHPYSDGSLFNYYDDVGQVVSRLDSVFSTLYSTLNHRRKYRTHHLCGHSTGGHIVLTYVSESKMSFSFDRIALSSPLTRFYFPPITVPLVNWSFDLTPAISGVVTSLGGVHPHFDIGEALRGKAVDYSADVENINTLLRHIQNNNGNQIYAPQTKNFRWSNKAWRMSF